MTNAFAFEPLSEDFRRNPFAELKRMRQNGPVYRHADTLYPVTSFFRSADIRPMANDWRKWSSLRPAELKNGSLGPKGILLTDDPPFHTEIKRIVLPYFSPSAMSGYESMILAHVDSILDKCIGVGEINFHRDVAQPLSAAVIFSIVGIPQSDRDLFLNWNDRGSRLDGRPVFWKSPEPVAEEEVRRLTEEEFEYFTSLRDRTSFDLGSGMFGRLATNIDDDMHLIGLCSLIIGAGIGTAANQMTHLIQELVNNPKQMATLREKSAELMDPAIEESLRFRGTARKLTRFATEDVETRGTFIAKGEAVVLWIASANRDEAIYDRPDEFDITRKSSRHITFGTGIHLCLGNALARMEIRVLMKRLLDRTRTVAETRGADSYELGWNAMSEHAERYSVELLESRR